MTKRNLVAVGLGATIVIAVALFVFKDQILKLAFSPTESSVPTAQTDEREIETIQQNLVTPWSISFLPTGDMLVTERSGQMQRFGSNGKTYQVGGVRETSEGGLLGVALHPNFASNNFIYLYLTTENDGKLSNQIERYQLKNDDLTNKKVVLSDIPASQNHNGGDIAFGPDEKVYVTTGDAQQEKLAQDTESLAGKILRLNDDGSVPDNNPFENEVWSYGHRNPQGIAWDDSDQLWSTEHGPSGVQSGRDELNLIKKAGNYGWPNITGDETADGMISPVIQSGDDETWAPAGIAHLNGTLYFTGLRGQTLYEATISDTGKDVSLKKSLTEEYGRMRAVTSFENTLYISTSNRDGRGTPSDEDDRIIKLSNL